MGDYLTTNALYCLLDDGTLDTVVEVTCERCGRVSTERISHGAAAAYRHAVAGELLHFGQLCDDLLDDEPCPRCEGQHE